MNNKKVPSVVVKRLPRYYRYLGELLDAGIKKISSAALSKKMNVTASQIRQDFNYFGGFGQQGYGYNVEYLYNEMGEILGIHDENPIIIIGAGNLGRALACHGGFARRGFRIVGIFDNKESVIGTKINNIDVHSIDYLPTFLEHNRADIAILAVPKAAVQSVADIASQSGVRGFLNFSYGELKLPEGTEVENVHISDPMMTLSYKIKKG